MLRLAQPTGRRYRQTLMTGMSLLEHPGFWRQRWCRRAPAAL